MPPPIGTQPLLPGTVAPNGRRQGTGLRDARRGAPVTGADARMPGSKPLASGSMQPAAALTRDEHPSAVPAKPSRQGQYRGANTAAAQGLAPVLPMGTTGPDADQPARGARPPAGRRGPAPAHPAANRLANARRRGRVNGAANVPGRAPARRAANNVAGQRGQVFSDAEFGYLMNRLEKLQVSRTDNVGGHRRPARAAGPVTQGQRARHLPGRGGAVAGRVAQQQPPARTTGLAVAGRGRAVPGRVAQQQPPAPPPRTTSLGVAARGGAAPDRIAQEYPPAPPPRTTSLGVAGQVRVAHCPAPHRRSPVSVPAIAANSPANEDSHGQARVAPATRVPCVGCVHLTAVLDDAQWLKLFTRFEKLRPKAGDSLFLRAKKAYKRDGTSYRKLKGALAEQLKLPYRSSAVAIFQAINVLQDTKAQADNAAQALGAKPELNDLSLDSGSSVDVARALMDLMLSRGGSVHAHGDLVHGDLIGGGRFAGNIVPGHSVVNIQVEGAYHPVNANVIDKSTIAAQAPSMELGDPDSLPAFYAMVMDHNVNTVVNLLDDNALALTHEEGGDLPNDAHAPAPGAANPAGPAAVNDECGRFDLKAQYWPREGKTASYQLGDRLIEVKTNRIQRYAGYQMITLGVTESAGQEERTVTIFHNTQWPVEGTTKEQDLEQLFSFARDVAGNRPGEGMTVVQSLHGTGCAGAFIVLDQMMAGIRAGVITRDNLLESLRDLIWNGIVARGNSFIRHSSDVEMLINRGLAAFEQRAAGQSASGTVAQSSVVGSQARAEQMLRERIKLIPVRPE